MWARSGERDSVYSVAYRGPAGTLVVPQDGSVDGARSATDGQLTLTERPVFVLYSGSAPTYPPPPGPPTPGPVQACGQLVNCSFEDGLNGWLLHIGQEDYTRSAWSPVHGGTRSARMAGSISGPYLQQDVPAAAGETKLFRGWINVPQAAPGMNVLVDLTPMTKWGGWVTPNGAPLWRSAVTQTTSGWVPLQATLVMPAGTGLLRVVIRGEPLSGSMFVDDLFVDRAP
jgi:hypothetical protein